MTESVIELADDEVQPVQPNPQDQVDATRETVFTSTATTTLSPPHSPLPSSSMTSSSSSTPTPFSAPMASKPRSNSSLHSSRPAPPSPAPSRPHSQLISLSPGGGGIGSGGGLCPSPVSMSGGNMTRPRASSTVSAVSSQGRGRSTAGQRSASASRPRPRSTLGEKSLLSGPPLLGPPLLESQTIISSDPKGNFDVENIGTSARELAPPAQTSVLSLAPALTPIESESTDPETSQVIETELTRRVVVRDYAFPPSDLRYRGLGPNRPMSNWCEGEPTPTPPVEDPAEAQRKSWYSGLSLNLSWNGIMGRRNMDDTSQSGTGSSGKAGAADDGSYAAETVDYRLPVPDHNNDEYAWSDEVDESGYDDDEDEEDDGWFTEEPFGIYRAAYAFSPEGVNEMAINVGDLLEVRGRGGGSAGWVVAVMVSTGVEGLVPEGYLERAHEREQQAFKSLGTPEPVEEVDEAESDSHNKA